MKFFSFSNQYLLQHQLRMTFPCGQQCCEKCVTFSCCGSSHTIIRNIEIFAMRLPKSRTSQFRYEYRTHTHTFTPIWPKHWCDVPSVQAFCSVSSRLTYIWLRYSVKLAEQSHWIWLRHAKLIFSILFVVYFWNIFIYIHT